MELENANIYEIANTSYERSFYDILDRYFGVDGREGDEIIGLENYITAAGLDVIVDMEGMDDPGLLLTRIANLFIPMFAESSPEDLAVVLMHPPSFQCYNTILRTFFNRILYYQAEDRFRFLTSEALPSKQHSWIRIYYEKNDSEITARLCMCSGSNYADFKFKKDVPDVAPQAVDYEDRPFAGIKPSVELRSALLAEATGDFASGEYDVTLPPDAMGTVSPGFVEGVADLCNLYQFAEPRLVKVEVTVRKNDTKAVDWLFRKLFEREAIRKGFVDNFEFSFRFSGFHDENEKIRALANVKWLIPEKLYLVKDSPEFVIKGSKYRRFFGRAKTIE